MLAHPLLLCYLLGPLAALTALLATSLDFLLVPPSLWRLAQCCTHLSPSPQFIVLWALPVGRLFSVRRPASDALMPNGTVALASAHVHMPGP